MTRYYDENGKEHYSLPRLWNNTSPITWEYLEKHGWTKVEEPAPEPQPEPERVVKYSRLAVMNKMKFLGIWDKAKEMMVQADMMDDWNYANELSSDYPKFQMASEQLSVLLPTGMTLEDFLSGCEIE